MHPYPQRLLAPASGVNNKLDPPPPCIDRPSVGSSALSVDDVLRSGDLPTANGPSAPSTDPFYCRYCRVSCSGPEPWRQHVQSAKHLKKQRQWGPASDASGLGGGAGGVGGTLDQSR